MIRHIVFFSAKDKKDIDVILDELKGYSAIPDIVDIEVSKNVKKDSVANDIDIVLHATFEDEAALERYKEHPIYKAGTAKIRPLRDLRFAADIETG